MTSALSADLFNLFRRGDLDMAILKQTASDELAGTEYDGRLIVSRMLRAVCNRRVVFGDLNEIPLVAFPDGCAYRRAALATLARNAKSSFFSYVSASYENIRSAVSAGLGIGVLSLGATAGDHFILTPKEGFPDLPLVHLRLMYRSEGVVFDQFAMYFDACIGPKRRTGLFHRRP